MAMEKKSSADPGSTGTRGEPVLDFPAGLAKPALRALAGAGYTRLEQLVQVTEAELLQLHGMGPKAMGQLRIALSERGLNFAEGS